MAVSGATALVIAYGAALVVWGVGLFGVVQHAERATLDARYRWRGPAPGGSSDVALVLVADDAALACRDPVPAGHLAAVVDALRQAGARLIGLDARLAEPSVDPAGAAALREAIAAAGNVVLASRLRGTPEGQTEALPPAWFGTAALDHGFADVLPGEGLAAGRSAGIAVQSEGRQALSLALTLAARALGLDTERIRTSPWGEPLPGLPGDLADRVRLLDYPGPPLAALAAGDGRGLPGLPACTSRHVLGAAAQELADLFLGRIVVVGSALTADEAPLTSPFGPAPDGRVWMSNPEVQACLVRTLLASAPPRRLGSFAAACLVVGAAFVAALAALRWGLRGAASGAGALVCAVWVGAFHAFTAYGLVWPLCRPTAGALLGAITGVLYLQAIEGRRRRVARECFRGLLSGSSLRAALQQPEAWSLEGEQREVTVVVCRFTRRSASSPTARQLVGVYREVWSALSPCVFRHGGAVLGFADDSLEAVFGAPVPARDHALRGVDAAIDMAETWIEAGWADRAGAVCIGVAHGQAVLGDLAGSARPSYRAVGDAVESARGLAARTGEPDGTVLITASLLEAVEDSVEAAPVDASASVQRVIGRRGARPLGTAARANLPFWKYRRLRRGGLEGMSETLLGQLPLFSEFNRRELRQLSQLFCRRTYRSQEQVFGQDEVGSAMYIIESGGVDILQRTEAGGEPLLLQRLRAGDFFGELALLCDVTRSAAAVAYGPTELLVLFQSDLYDLVEREPELGVRLLRALSRVIGERLIRTNQALVQRLTRPPEGQP